MINQELILLGLLRERPRHGYEIKKQIREILSLFAGVELKSIYYPLRILEKRGLVVQRASKQGRRPQRFVYELTPKGESRFNALLAESLLKLTRPQFSLDVSLYFLRYIKPEVAKRRLHARIYILKKLGQDLSQMLESQSAGCKKDPSLLRILRHNLKMLEAESKFLSEIIRTV